MNPLYGRERIIGYGLMALAALVIVGPFAWIFMNSLKYQVAIYTGAWVFTPTWSNYMDVLFSRRSDFAHNVRNSLIVAGVSTALV